MVVKRGVSQLGGFRTTGFEVFMRVGLKSSAKIQKNFEICKFLDTKMLEKCKKCNFRGRRLAGTSASTGP